MDSRINIIKGVHPGKLIERELKKKYYPTPFSNEDGYYLSND